MVQVQWLRLKMKSLWHYEHCYLEGGWTYDEGEWPFSWGKATAGVFYYWGDEKNFGSWEDSHFELVGNGGIPLVGKTLIFRLNLI